MSQRIDKWIWHARIVRTRTLASELASAGKIRIDKRRVTRASQTVHCGNVVTVPQGNRIRVLKVIGFSPGVGTRCQGPLRGSVAPATTPRGR